jgi:hypothetical protein
MGAIQFANVRPLVACVCVAAALTGCAAPGPSLKQQADESAARKVEHRKQEEFTKSLPPTQSTPIYKP